VSSQPGPSDSETVAVISETAAEHTVHLPDPTPWPLFLALGLTLVGGGLIVNPFQYNGMAISVTGAILLFLAVFQLIREDIAHFESSES
jgi:hypothetical protein